jgi:glutamate-ammonia-ligase adenylyltransferase
MFHFLADLSPAALPDPIAGVTPEISDWKTRFPESATQLDACVADPVGNKLLAVLCSYSPFLWKITERNLPFFLELLATDPHTSFQRTLSAITNETYTTQPTLMQALRIAKQQVALLTAIADLTGYWDVEDVTDALSQFAETSIRLCVSFLLTDGFSRKQLALREGETLEHAIAHSGLIVLAMGKLGGFELNYSSDVDLTLFVDLQKFPYIGNKTAQHYCIALARDLVQMMQERTKDGYVFRMDLRLRPDPASMPLVVSVDTAMSYYESVGQNWERMALIKARPVGGDIRAGEMFLDELRPFIWRKHLDFAMIDDIHSIKRQIDSTYQSTSMDNLLGYNIKTGRGGIREIEFFTTIQQLIWGGRELSVREMPTCRALDALVSCKKVTPETASELIEVYYYLRKLEHRLQMVADEQTHKLPQTMEALDAIAGFMGYANTNHFLDDLTGKLRLVQKHYAELCEESPALGSEAGSLVFTGTENDSETVRNIAQMGFTQPDAIAEMIRGWHHGRARATRNKRARELLTELTPSLLTTFGATANPDRAFLKFNDFLNRLPAGVQIFSLFAQYPEMLSIIAEIMGSYPYLAENLSRKPVLLEYVLSQDFLDPLKSREALSAKLHHVLGEARQYEDILNITRHWTHDRQFRVGVQLIKKLITPTQARESLSDIAATVLDVLLGYVQEEFSAQHGMIEGGEFAVVALGKLGGRSLTFGSDIDLVFVYDVPSMQAMSDGAKPLQVSDYYSRLIRRYISAFASLTSEGKLYDIDMRLRPSGKDGPVASSIEAFTQYYENAAWTWEFMALTKATVIAGDAGLREKVTASIATQLTKGFPPEQLRKDVHDIRERVAQQYPSSDPWDIKYVRGGLMDCEFLAQYFLLLYAKDHPDILTTSTGHAFENLARHGLITNDEATTFSAAFTLLLDMQTILRLASGTISEQGGLSAGGKDELVRLRPEANFDALERNLIAAEKQVSGAFLGYIGKAG